MADEQTDDQQTDDTEEQSDKDQAGGEESGVEGDAEADEKDGDEKETDDSEEGDEEADEDLIGQKRFDELKDNPAQLRKELNAAATKKFQKLSGERKALEPYADFIKSYEDDPRGAAMALAEQLGIEVVKPKSVAKSEAAVENVADQIRSHVKEALGPEYEDIADKMATAIQRAAQLMVDEAVKPLKEGQETLIHESAMREAGTALKAFGEKHPDWKQHEKDMVALSRKVPVGGQSEAEYLENIYFLVTRSGAKGDALKKAAKRMSDSARKSDGGGRNVSDSSVSKSPAGKLPTFAESAAAAQRGEKFD